jgi:hypothetical protein
MTFGEVSRRRRIHNNLLQPVRFFGFANLLLVAELLAELLNDFGRDKGTNLRKAVVGLFGEFEEVVGRHTLVAGERHFDIEEAVEFRILNGGDTMTLRPFAPLKV